MIQGTRPRTETTFKINWVRAIRVAERPRWWRSERASVSSWTVRGACTVVIRREPKDNAFISSTNEQCAASRVKPGGYVVESSAKALPGLI